MKPMVKKLGAIILIGLFLFWSFIAGIERLVFFNMSQYPDYLVNNIVKINSKEQINELVKLTCPNGGADVVKKKDATYARCGLLWPTSKVSKIYIINKTDDD